MKLIGYCHELGRRTIDYLDPILQERLCDPEIVAGWADTQRKRRGPTFHDELAQMEAALFAVEAA